MAAVALERLLFLHNVSCGKFLSRLDVRTTCTWLAGNTLNKNKMIIFVVLIIKLFLLIVK